jgi:hypothetical protein
MNRLEMAKELLNNKKLKAKNNKGAEVYVAKTGESYTIRWCEDNEVLIFLELKNETWEIIKPKQKLKEFDISEIIYVYSNTILDEDDCISLVTNKTYNRNFKNMTLDELRGKWVIKGYYEKEDL